VNGSFRIATPSTAATAGLTYVKTVARTGPTSAISAKKITKASAVQTMLRPSTDAITRPAGTSVGKLVAAIGTYASAVIPSEAAITPNGGRSARKPARIAGPTA
jgi:hypothetical protein